MPKYSKWATSQIQFIRDRSIRDSYTKEPMWKRIYPQRDGVPVYNPHGKYWVKLHHLGEERLVEIDDRMPCNSKGHIMLPHSDHPFEIWPALLTKAIIKLYSYQWTYKDNCENEVGDASIVHALTGLLPEKIDLNNFQVEKWQNVKRLLSDDHYFNKKTYMCGYCMTDFNPTLPSLAKYIKPEEKPASESNAPESSSAANAAPVSGGSRALLKLKKFANMALSVTSGKKVGEPTKDKPSNVVKGFGYALLDYFENDGFDMAYAAKEDRDSIAEKTSPYSPEKRKKRRAMGGEEGKKSKKDSDTMSKKSSRVGKKQIRKYQFVKIKSAVSKIPILNAVIPFTNDEITMAKKCMLNKWEKPPDYDKRRQKFEMEQKKAAVIPEESQKPQESVVSGDKSQKPADKTDRPTEKEEKFSEESKKEHENDPEIEEDKNEIAALEPKTRAPGGLWMEASDLAHCFQYILIFHNPRSYASKVNVKDLWSNSNELFIPNEEKFYIQLKPGTAEEEEKTKAMISEEFKDLPVDLDYEKSKILVSFAPNACLLKGNEPATNYSCTIPQFSLKLTNYLSSKLINIKDIGGCLAIQPNIVAPFGYSMWVMSNYQVSKMSEIEYLCSPAKNYVKKELEIEAPQMLRNRYYTIFRCTFTCKETKTDCLMKFNITDKYLLECMRFHIINQKQPSAPDGKIKSAELFEGDHMIVQHNIPFSLKAGNYTLICDLLAPYNIEATKMNLALATLPEIQDFANLELEEQAEYGDLYTPYKYGIIFRERIFAGKDTPISMHIRLRKGGYSKPAPPKEEKKVAKKGEEEKPVVTPEKEIDPPRRMKLEIFEDGDSIYSKTAYNHLSIPHLKLSKTEEIQGQAGKFVHSYIIQCGFDISDWPECVKKSEETNELGWVIKVVAPGSVSIVKDTEKADREQAIKESWEEAEAGRAEKGKQSRAKFLALRKKLKGEKLTEQEQELLKENVAKKEEEKKTGPGAKKAPPPKDNKKPAAGKPGQAPPKEEETMVNLELDKPLPNPDAHINQEIKEYLEHAKKDRLIIIHDTKKKAKTRVSTEIDQIKQKSDSEIQAFEKYYKEKKEKDEQEKKLREESKAKFQQGLQDENIQGAMGFKEILLKRDDYKGVLLQRKAKEDELQSMIKADKIDISVFFLDIE